MYVIFNADDYGLSQGVNTGIIDSSNQGVVRSTTLMVGMEAEQHGIDLLTTAPSLKLGLHFRLTAGAALLSSSSLTDNYGQFLTQDRFWPRTQFNENELFDELSLQVEQFKKTGATLSHIDSHHHVHTHPQVLPVVLEVAKLHRVPVRGQGTGYQGNRSQGTRNKGKESRDQRKIAGGASLKRYCFSDVFYGDSVDVSTIVKEIKRLQAHTDVLEFMCHPAHLDESLKAQSSYYHQRATELNTLTSEQLKEALHEAQVTVTDYSILDE